LEKNFISRFFFLNILKYNRLKIQRIFEKKIKFKNLLDVGTTPVFDKYNNILLHTFKNNKNITSLLNLDCSSLKKNLNGSNSFKYN
jgi:hypothetical protein